MSQSPPLEILSCPITRRPLRVASAAELEEFGVVGHDGLIREDGEVLYPVRNGIPELVPEAAISRRP